MIPSYRDPRYAASIRLELLHERAGEPSDHIPREIRRFHARRSARTASGLTATIGFVLLALVTGAQKVLRRGDLAGVPTFFLLGAIIATLVVYAIAYFVAEERFDRHVLGSFDSSEDALAQVARIESNSIRRAAARVVMRKERASVMWPLIGMGLLAPLSIHLLVWALLSGHARDTIAWLDSFDMWIGLSLLLVGVAHGVLAIVGWAFADLAAATRTERLEAKSPVSGWAALGYTVLGSLFPGVIALAIPPIVVFLTGVLFVPVLYSSMHDKLVAERKALEAF